MIPILLAGLLVAGQDPEVTLKGGLQ